MLLSHLQVMKLNLYIYTRCFYLPSTTPKDSNVQSSPHYHECLAHFFLNKTEIIMQLSGSRHWALKKYPLEDPFQTMKDGETAVRELTENRRSWQKAKVRVAKQG